MENRLHIVLANRWYPPHSGFGGVAMYNYYLSRALVELGHQVTVVASRNDEKTPGFEELGQIQVHRLLTKHRYWLSRIPFLGHYMRSLLLGLYSYRLAKMLNKLEKEQPIDVIEFAEVGGEGYFYLRQKQRSPVVVRCHTPTFVLQQYHLGEEMPYDTSLTISLEKYCIRHADALTAPSYHMAQTVAQWCDIPVEDITPIPNPLDIDAFNRQDLEQSSLVETNQPSTDFIILHVGRLERVKGIDLLIEVIPKVLEIMPKARFVFIGAARSELKEIQYRKKLEEAGQGRVTFLGFVDQLEMLQWYQKSDIVVVPSLNYESFSYTCAQAMAAGLPVVASRIGGIPETIGDAGLVVELGDALQLAAALLKLIQCDNLRASLGNLAFQRAQQNFDAMEVAKQMTKFYQEII